MLKSKFPSALAGALFALLLLLGGAALAQNGQTAAQRLDSLRAELDQFSIAMRRDGLSDAELTARRADVDPLAGTISEVIEQLAPRAESIKARLDQLGPTDKDKDKDKEKDPAVEAERADQQKAFN